MLQGERLFLIGYRLSLIVHVSTFIITFSFAFSLLQVWKSDMLKFDSVLAANQTLATLLLHQADCDLCIAHSRS
jgi:hypothetical protein